MGVIKYDSNNSGGGWWLSDDDWLKLEQAGWVVHWYHSVDDPSHEHGAEQTGQLVRDHSHSYVDQLVKVTPSGDRFLGAMATSAAKETDDPQAAVEEWSTVTGKDPSDVGCNCCGQPHSFEYTDDEGNTQYTSAVVAATRLEWS